MISLNSLKKACFVLVITQVLIVATAQAGVIVVDSTGDASRADGVCTLREAIQSLHDSTTLSTGCMHSGTYGLSDLILFDTSLHDQVILLDQGSPLLIKKELIIVGPGPDKLTIDGHFNGLKRIFHIDGLDNRFNVKISNLTISKGQPLGGNGGGIYITNSNLVLTNSIVSGNSAVRGGGIYITNSNLVLTRSIVSGNSAAFLGGGIYGENNTSITLNFSTVSNNSASKQGGGIYVADSSVVSVNSSTVSFNFAGTDGGGIFAINDSVVLVNSSTVSGNRAQELGGGIMSMSSRVETLVSTISSNTAQGGGGVLFASNDSGVALRIRQTTIINNAAGDDGGGVGLLGDGALALISNSIIAGNVATDSGDEFAKFGGTFVANANNVLGDSSNSNAQAFVGFIPDLSGTDIIATSNGTMPTVLSSILKTRHIFNGGPTRTHALVVGSPAIDAGASFYCPGTDQRGVLRSDGQCDIGSFEFESLIFSDSFE